MIDLTVNGWCETIYRLQTEVEQAPPPDDVDRGDYRALAAALQDLYALVAEKVNRDLAERER